MNFLSPDWKKQLHAGIDESTNMIQDPVKARNDRETRRFWTTAVPSMIAALFSILSFALALYAVLKTAST